MGEYLNNGTKVGTCENLYYATFKQLSNCTDSAKADFLNPKHGYRYRFPFPDEDKMQMGSHEDYDRGVEYGINRADLPEDFRDGWPKVKGRGKSTFGSRDVSWEAENPNNTENTIYFEIAQQKQSTEQPGVLCIVFRCPFTANRSRIESKEDIIKLVAAIKARYINGHNTEKYEKFHDEILKRICDGYGLEYESKFIKAKAI